MSVQFEDTGYLSVDLTATANKYERVDFDGTVAGITEIGIGTVQQYGQSGDTVAVASISKQGTYIAIASEAITAGAAVYTAAAGKVGASASTAFRLGFAKTAASADGDLIEVVPSVGDTAVA